MTFDNNNNNLLHLYSALHFLVCFSLLQGHPRCRCLCFRSSFNFYILRVKPFVSISHIMEVYGHHPN